MDDLFAWFLLIVAAVASCNASSKVDDLERQVERLEETIQNCGVDKTVTKNN